MQNHIVQFASIYNSFEFQLHLWVKLKLPFKRCNFNITSPKHIQILIHHLKYASLKYVNKRAFYAAVFHSLLKTCISFNS